MTATNRLSLSISVCLLLCLSLSMCLPEMRVHTHTPMAIFDPVIYACLAAAAHLIKLINELQLQRISIGQQIYLRDTYSTLQILFKCCFFAFVFFSSFFFSFSSILVQLPRANLFVICVHNKAISWKIFLVVATAAAEKIKRSPRQPQMKRA